MDVLFGDVSSNDLYIVGMADLSYEVSCPCPNGSREDGLSIFRCPNKMVFAIKDRMGG